MADNTLTAGQQWLKDLQDQGLTDANIGEMKRQRTQDLLGAGYKQDDIDKYFGEQPSQIPAGMKSIAADNLHIAGHDPATMDTADPNSWTDLFKTGFGNSVLSLEYSGAPTKQLPNSDELGFFGHLAASAGQMLGDAPAGITGLLGAGFVTKNPMAAGAAYNAVPEAIRQMYIKHYQTGAPLDWHDAFTKPVLAAAAVGAVGGKAAEVGGTVAAAAGGNKLIQTGSAALAAQIAATGTQSAMAGHLPTASEFAAGTAFALGFGFGGAARDIIYSANSLRGRIDLTDIGQAAKKRMEGIYARTGIHPTDAARAASSDPVLRQTVMGGNADGDTITDPWLHAAKPEPPKAEKPPEKTVTGEVIPPAKSEYKHGETQIDPPEAVKINPHTGVASVSSLKPEQLDAIVSTAEDQLGIKRPEEGTPEAGERAANIADAAKKYVNKDGSVDLEAAIIDHSAGEDQAKAFRASGRDVSSLPAKTQRLLSAAGDMLDGNYKLPVPQEGGGGGKPPAPPEPPSPGEGEKPFQKSPEFSREDMNAKTKQMTQGSKWADYARAIRNGAWWRELAPATRFDKTFDVVKSEKDMGLEDWLRLAYATSGRVKARIYRGGIKLSADEQGMPFYDVNDKVPSMKSIMERAAKLPGGYDTFRAYMQALDTLDRAKLGLKTTYDPGEAAAHIMAEKSPTGAFKELDALAKDWQKMMDDTLQGLKRSGRLNDAGIAAFKERHPNYFPQRVFKDRSNDMRGPRGTGAGNPIKNAEGHGYVLQDPIQTTVEDIFRREKFNDLNIARRVAVDNLMKHFGGAPSEAKDLVVQTKPPKPEGSKLPAPLDVAWKNGIIDEEGGQSLDDPEFYNHNPNVIRYWKDGKPMEYRVPDFEFRKEFMDMIMSPKLTEQDFVKSVIGASARGLRATVMSYPATVLRVMLQDSVQASVLSKYGGVPLFNSLHGGMMLLDDILSRSDFREQGPMAREWIRQEMNGNYNMALTDINANHVEELWHSMAKTAHLQGYANGYSKVMDGFQQFMRQTDAMTRAKIASNAGKELGVMKGSVYARTVHGDYAESSASQGMNFLAALTPFMRARMRGFIDGSLRAVKNETTHFAMGAATLGVVSAMVHAYNYWFDKQYEDKIPLNERYSEQPNDVRDSSWMIPYINSRGEVVRFKVPAGPFEIGYLVNAPVNRFMHKFFSDDPASFHGLAGDIVKRLMVDNIPGIDNPAAKTIIESKTGVDLFTMRPIIPSRLAHMSADKQVLPWTTSTARAVSAGINNITGGNTVSPITLDKTMDNWIGGTGVALLKTLEAGTGLGPVTPPHDMANGIWWGSFFARNPGMRAESISRFYTTYSEAEKKHDPNQVIRGKRPPSEPDMQGFREHTGDLRQALNSSEDPATVSKSMKVVRNSMNPSKGNDAFNNLRRASAALGRLNTASYLIQNNPKLSEDDKRQLIDTLADQAIRISRIAVTRYKTSKEYGDGSQDDTGN